jgi:hypothetical protein
MREKQTAEGKEGKEERKLKEGGYERIEEENKGGGGGKVIY